MDKKESDRITHQRLKETRMTIISMLGSIYILLVFGGLIMARQKDKKWLISTIRQLVIITSFNHPYIRELKQCGPSK